MMWKNLLSVSEKFDWFDNDERILLFATGEARDSQRQFWGRRVVCMLFFYLQQNLICADVAAEWKTI